MHSAQRRTKNTSPPPYYENYGQYPMMDPNQGPTPMNYYSPQMQGNQQWGPSVNYSSGPPTSSQVPPGQFQPFVNEQLAAMAMQYGQVIAGQGKGIVQEKMEKYGSFFTHLKYYFAVDTSYVLKKLGLLFFPFTHKDWAVHYNNEEPIAPRYEINAPDLYIPSMAFVTYILITGYLMGLDNKFSPEQLGRQASSALGWVALEIILVLLTHYLFSIMSSSLKLLDIVAFCTYKFVSIITALLSSLFLGQTGYYVILSYSAISLGFYLMRTLRVAILSKAEDGFSGGSKRMLYLVTFMCICQPLMMYWLTYHLINIKTKE